jgi:hypothetical protein
MFRSTVAMPLLAPEDGAAGAGGEGADAGDPGYEPGLDDGTDDPALGEAGDDAAERHAGSEGEGEDDDVDLVAGRDDDDDDDTRPLDEKTFRKLLKDNRRLKRKVAKNVAVNARLKGVDLDGLMHAASQYQALQQRLQNNARLRRLLIEGRDDADDEDGGTPATTRRPAVPQQDEPFNEQVPWNTADESGKYFLEQARTVHQLRGQLRTMLADHQRALKRIDSLEGGVQRDRQSAIESRWAAGIDAAAKQIKDPNIRDLFLDSVKGSYHYARMNGKTLDPNATIKHYLKKAGVNPTTQRIAAGAAAQRMAQRNQSLPRHQAGGPGAPTPARATKERTVADVSRRIRQIG